jgi:hypothetical protein
MVLGPGMHHFSIHLPSPTTVSFTVSTRPLYGPVVSATTNASRAHVPSRVKVKVRIFTLLKNLLRMFLVLYTALVNVVKAQDSILRSSARLNSYADLWLRLSLFSGFIKFLAEKAEWWILVPVSLGIVYACLRRDYVGT